MIISLSQLGMACCAREMDTANYAAETEKERARVVLVEQRNHARPLPDYNEQNIYFLRKITVFKSN